jgi:hypothetical protein
MRRIRPITSVVVLICLFAFQAQAFARVSMPCQHERAMATACPMHSATRQLLTPEDQATQILDCVKCALVLSLGSVQVAPSSGAILLTPSGAAHTAKPADHFYRFFPERPIRPPQGRSV